MRDLVVTENITLDGVIEATEGWFAPSGSEDAAESAELAAVEREHREGADAVLLGRVTYQEFEGYWPKQTDDPSGVADYLNQVEKYVVSGSLPEPSWQRTTVLRGPVGSDVAALKEQAGAAIVATGSIQLVHALSREGLVDEYRLWVYPVVLGRGRRLFADGLEVSKLRLVEARPFSSGIALLRYRLPDSG